MNKIKLSEADFAALKAFADDEATQDDLAAIDLEIQFTHRSGWKVLIDVYESTSHCSAEGEWCPTLAEAFTSAYSTF